ncbi:MAG: S8 family peptidase [Bacteroidia bacterium]|nr:S8 family peptidase [Bacteroidia bacterium]
MKIRIAIYIVSFFALVDITPVHAQVKLTNETRECFHKISTDAAYLESYGNTISQQLQDTLHSFLTINNTMYINLQGFISNDFNADYLEKQGILISVHIGNVVSLKVPIRLITRIESLQGIEYLETPPNMTPFLDRAIGDIRADSVHQGISLPQGYSGKDVIIGIIDWGFDYTHPIFYDSFLQRNRIIAAWDHYKKSGPAPSKYGYGTVYIGTDELLAAQSDTAYGSIYETHGTHVAGIAGGGGAGIGLFGVAYNCEFLLVQPDWQKGNFLDCVDWLYEMAKQRGKRLVINMSFGSYNKATLDTFGIYHTVAKEYTKKGVVMVASAGNNGNSKMHIKHTFNYDEMQTQINMYPLTTSFPNYWGQYVLAWGEPGKSFSCALDIYNGSSKIYSGEYFNTDNTNTYEDNIKIANNSMYFKVQGEKSHPLNNKPRLTFTIRKTNDLWKVVLRTKADNGTVHYWNIIQTTGNTSNTGLNFISFKPDWEKGNDSFCVSDPATTPYIISVAAHTAEIRSGNTTTPGAIADFSSHGPTIDNLPKPNISAPGVQILSSVSTFTTQPYTVVRTIEFNSKTYPFARFSGTSMSGPAVTGVAALLLEANPELSPAQIKEILMKTAYQDSKTGALQAPFGNMTWGVGKVDAYAGIMLALDTKGIIYKNGNLLPYPNPATNSLFYQGSVYEGEYEIKIYNMLGELVFEGKIGALLPIDISNFLNGMYVAHILDKEWKTHKIIISNQR